MSSKVTIKISNEFINMLKEHQNKTAENAAIDILETSRSLCPVSTGNLRSSIEVEVDGDTYSIGSPLDYSEFIEYGTRTIAPQPFLRPSLAEVIGKYN